MHSSENRLAHSNLRLSRGIPLLPLGIRTSEIRGGIPLLLSPHLDLVAGHPSRTSVARGCPEEASKIIVRFVCPTAATPGGGSLLQLLPTGANPLPNPDLPRLARTGTPMPQCCRQTTNLSRAKWFSAPPDISKAAEPREEMWRKMEGESSNALAKCDVCSRPWDSKEGE